jgi:hypothetical protein
MQGRAPSMRAALALLGLAEGADREAVIHAYRRLARATHPDRSDAPDAAARFAAIAAAYREALDGTDASVLEPATSPTVPITVHATRDDPFLRRGAMTGVGRLGLDIIGDPTVIDPPIVAGPVRVVPPSFHPRGRATGRSERDG